MTMDGVERNVMAQKLNRRMVLGGLAALPACRASGSKLNAEVIILGAGLAGLHAARLLSAEGKDILVLEGASRIGGRLHTLDHGNLSYTEGGGEQIGASYARLIDTARQLDVDLIPDAPNRRETTYHFQGGTYTPADWKTLTPPPFPPPFEGGNPSAPLFALASKGNPLKSSGDWLDPKFLPFDISAQEFLSQAGFNGDAQKVIEQALNGNSLRSYSMMNLYRTLQLYAQSRGMGASLSVKNGAQRLPEAMAASLPRKVRLEQMVKSISVEAESVLIETANGKTYRGAQCICSLPFGALRHISIKAFMPDAQSSAIRELPYTQILQIHLKAKTPFWEADGLPADMWTDLPIERIFADRDDDGSPNGLFRVWINGRGATRSIWADRTKISERVSAYMKTVRPASEGQFDVLAVQDWTKTNALAGGAYMHWAPRQIGQWADSIAAPSSRLAFAGEHLSRLHTGMEGAMESGENAAFYLLDI
ncbi:MAG: NAD(P)/FAD-dependent oxidoreductase [Hellea sp.]